MYLQPRAFRLWSVIYTHIQSLCIGIGRAIDIYVQLYAHNVRVFEEQRLSKKKKIKKKRDEPRHHMAEVLPSNIN